MGVAVTPKGWRESVRVYRCRALLPEHPCAQRALAEDGFLYWESIRRIVPRNFQPEHDDEYGSTAAVAEELVESTPPNYVVQAAERFRATVLPQLHQEFKRPVRVGEEVQEVPRHRGLVFAVLLLGAAQEPAVDFERAEREIVRVPPLYFLRLPPAIREALESRGCTVPQTWGEPWPNNAVRGHFTGASTDDWAVLCSKRGASSLLVFSGGKVVASFPASPDRHFLAGIIPGRAVYERTIKRIEPREIRGYCRTFGEKCPSIDHDGIEEALKSNASEVHYFDGRKWLKLPGAD